MSAPLIFRLWRFAWCQNVRPFLWKIPCRLRGHDIRFNRCLPPCSRWF